MCKNTSTGSWAKVLHTLIIFLNTDKIDFFGFKANRFLNFKTELNDRYNILN